MRLTCFYKRFVSGFVSAALVTAGWEWAGWAAQVGRGETASEFLQLSDDVWKRYVSQLSAIP